jgi:LuxR family maltose regulon positive regulatory protein
LREKRRDASSLCYLEELAAKLADRPSAHDTASMQQRANMSKTDGVLTHAKSKLLGLVAQTMSNKCIALTLNFTLETVKLNLPNIFAKLGVSSRYDAMVWARNEGLIH